MISTLEKKRARHFVVISPQIRIGLAFLARRRCIVFDVEEAGRLTYTFSIPLGQFLEVVALRSAELRDIWRVWSDLHGGTFNAKVWKSGSRNDYSV